MQIAKRSAEPPSIDGHAKATGFRETSSTPVNICHQYIFAAQQGAVSMVAPGCGLRCSRGVA
jgi:hypothetical protein